MRADWRWILIAAVAPISWGSTYFVTAHFLPDGHPLWGAALRALPAGLIMLALARQLPSGSWWWRSAVLGVLNFGGFFVLIYLAALLLPGSVASSIMAVSPLAMAGLGWLVLRERPSAWMGIGAALGIAGVLLILGAGLVPVNPWGVICSITALLMSSLGSVLNKRWSADQPLIASTAWQATAGALLLVVLAAVVEGAPPQLDATALAGFAYLSLIATAAASLCWFGALAHLKSGVVGIVALLNPVTGVLLGVLAGSETLSVWQSLGILLVLIGIMVGRARANPVSRRPAQD